MGHSRARDNWKKRIKRRKWMERFRLENTCCVCGKSIYRQAQQYSVSESGEISNRKCMRCADRENYARYERTGILTGHLIMVATLSRSYWFESNAEQRLRRRVPTLDADQCSKICSSIDRITTKVKDFERDVWFKGGLQEHVQKQTDRGLKAETTEFEALLFSSAGRVLITLTDTESKESITLITAEDEKPYARRELTGSEDMGPMGIQGLDCTEDAALYLLELAMANFPTAVPAPNVSIC